MKTNTKKFRPLSAKCAGVCTGTFGFTLTACYITYLSIHRDGVSQLLWLMPGLLAVLHCVLVVFSVCKWDSYVYLHNNSVVQVQWGKEIVIPYGEISGVKIVRRPSYPPSIIIFCDRKKIVFDASKEDIFLTYCTNKVINAKIKPR